MKNKMLVVVTSFEKYPTINRPTVLWLGEAVHFVKKVEAAGYTIDFVSPKGGYTPIDPHSLAMAEPVDWEFYQNKAFMNRLGTTLAPSAVNPDDYVCIYYAGGHGVVWDFPNNAALQAISRKIYESGGIVSSVCHGAVGLLNIQLQLVPSVQRRASCGSDNSIDSLALPRARRVCGLEANTVHVAPIICARNDSSIGGSVSVPVGSRMSQNGCVCMIVFQEEPKDVELYT